MTQFLKNIELAGGALSLLAVAGTSWPYTVGRPVRGGDPVYAGLLTVAQSLFGSDTCRHPSAVRVRRTDAAEWRAVATTAVPAFLSVKNERFR